MGTTMGTMPVTLEELGKNMGKCLECTIEYDLEPGEKRTWDYPGSPAQAHLTGVRVHEYSDENITLHREEKPEWFLVLDEIAESLIEGDWANLEERIFEREGDAYEAARDDYYDRKYDEMRGC